jgi:hypothetical protein
MQIFGKNLIHFFQFNICNSEALAKLLEAVENRHSGQAKRDPESRISNLFWIPAFAGMTE